MSSRGVVVEVAVRVAGLPGLLVSHIGHSVLFNSGYLARQSAEYQSRYASWGDA